MIIDISSIVTCENKSLTEKVQIELESFVSRLGEFPIIEKAPIDLQIANIDGGKLRISGTVDLAATVTETAADANRKTARQGGASQHSWAPPLHSRV